MRTFFLLLLFLLPLFGAGAPTPEAALSHYYQAMDAGKMEDVKKVMTPRSYQMTLEVFALSGKLGPHPTTEEMEGSKPHPHPRPGTVGAGQGDGPLYRPRQVQTALFLQRRRRLAYRLPGRTEDRIIVHLLLPSLLFRLDTKQLYTYNDTCRRKERSWAK